LRILHLSRASDASDGGIAMAVAGLLEAQRASMPLEAHWLTPASQPAFAAAVAACDAELLHVHGLWRAPNRLAARLQHRLPVVVAPHGMLDPWAFARHRRRKTLLWWAYERRSLQRAAALQALCPAEQQALRRLGLTAPVALIPNGVALPAATTAAAAALPPPCWAGRIPAGESVLLFLGRFHHKKGLQPLLQAWQSLAEEARRAGWWLALVGYGDAGRLQQQLAAAPIPRCQVFAPAFAEAKAALLHSASAFVLPSFSEGLPMAALEAMAHRLPCLLSAACNLPDAFSAGAALPAEPEPVALSAALRRLFSLTAAERAAMGAAGRALMEAHYSWPRVAEQTLDLYRWILGGGEPPGFVDLG
jgi:poly(glycerol-phosphate) alpha-glucosyltransferase